MAHQREKSKKKIVEVAAGIVYVHASLNNTIVTVTDIQGNVLTSYSGGSSGLGANKVHGAMKSSPMVARMIGLKIGDTMKNSFNMKTITIYVKGPGPGRTSVLSALSRFNFSVASIRDKTGMPHNGCRPKKARRV